MAVVHLPKGALETDTSITIKEAANPPAGFVGTAYEFGPDGTNFLKDVTITIFYDEADLPTTANEADLQLATVENDAWKDVDGFIVDAKNNSVSGDVSHFSTYAVTSDVTDQRPDAPSNLSAEAGDGQITLSWSNPQGATSYNVYMAEEAGVTPEYYATLDGAKKNSSVPNPFTQTGLNNGTRYYFIVTALNSWGESPASAEVSAELSLQEGEDTTPPIVSLTITPASPTSSTTASIYFISNEGDTSFDCWLDGSSATACTSPKIYNSLSEGDHTFQVIGTDPALNVSLPASHTWTVDTTPPIVSLTSTPASPTNSTTATISFTSNEGDTSFDCWLDGSSAVTCTSPQVYNSLSEGEHTFKVNGTDSALNVSGPASHTWTVDTTPPTVAAPAEVVVVAANTNSVFSSDTEVAAFLNGATATDNVDTGNIPTTHNAPSSFLVGGTTVIFSATDTAGNTGSATALIRVVPPDPDKFLIVPVRSGPEQADNQASAEAYYNLIDPDDARTTLDDWKSWNSFNDSLPNSGADAHALYQNDADLGFVRDMYVMSTSHGHEGFVASYVQNYRTLEGAILGYETGDQSDLIATVAMEYSDPTESGEPEFTTFWVYAGPVIADSDPSINVGDRILSADLDGRGEKFLPGLCTPCHGGTPSPVATDSSLLEDANLGSGFLPWDPEVFKFSTKPGYTRAEQEAQFRELNRAVLDTNPSAAARELIEGSYGGVTLPNPIFDPTFVPAGWNTAPDLYLDVIAPSCRACHIQRPGLDFSTHDAFKGLMAATERTVFDEGIMPLAKRTFEHFWGSQNPFQPEVLAQHLEGLGSFSHRAGDGSLLKPGRPIAKPESPPGPHFVTDPIELDGSKSLFASTYGWIMNSRPTGSIALLSGSTTATPSFMPDVVGAYEIGLVVNNGLVDSEETGIIINAVDSISVLTFDADVAPMLLTECGGCHSGAFPSGGFDVTVYSEVLTRATTLDSNLEIILLSKPLGIHPGGHGGGTVFSDTSDPNYLLTLDWINAGLCESEPC